MNPEILTKQNFTTKEAAAYLEHLGTPFATGTLEVWRSQGKGPMYIKVKDRVFYPRKGLDAFSMGEVIHTVDSARIL